MEACSVGKSVQDKSSCHKTTYTNSKVVLSTLLWLKSDKELLKLRSGRAELPDDATACLHHQKIFLAKHSFLQWQCCDPFNVFQSSMWAVANQLLWANHSLVASETTRSDSISNFDLQLALLSERSFHTLHLWFISRGEGVKELQIRMNKDQN